MPRDRSLNQPEALAVWKSQPSALAPELLEGAVQRLGWVCIAQMLSAATVYLGGSIIQPGWVNPAAAPVSYSAGLGLSFLLSAILYAVILSRRIPPVLIADAGLIFMAVSGFFISLAETSIPVHAGDAIHGQSTLAVWIAFFVLAVPSTLGKMALAASATAMMGPATLAIHIVAGNIPRPPGSHWFLRFATTFLVAAWAVLLSRYIHRLGARAGQAIEMGSYRLVERIDRGGMGEVWRAEHRLLARRAAIKLIRPDVLGGNTRDRDAMLARFQREAKATAALHSPHTVALYDYGVSQSGSFYYVMELLDGINMEDLVKRFGPLPAARAIHLLRQVCSSLTEAHDNGLTHRDIKPGNILVCRLGASFDFVKVVDFGLVKLAPEAAHTQLTREGVVTGTPAFLAPELGRGSSEADARVDIYGLGCVAYWLLTGKLVFEAGSMMAMVLAHMRDTPSPPSSRTSNPIPLTLDEVVLMCLEKEPERRPQSARELSDRLAEILSGEPWTASHAEQWWRTHMDPRSLTTTV
jgi:tRNA A-37 threonylcarbamoyl transferase component Bud32